MKYIISADPGSLGGLALISENKDVSVLKMPQKNGEIDAYKITEFINSVNSKEIFGVTEDLHSLFGASTKSTFQLGRALGILEGVFSALNIKFEKIQPKVWQKNMFEGIEILKHIKNGKEKTDTKAMALLAVKKLYPNVNLLPTSRCKKPSDGIVDAILIGEYYRRKIFENGK